MSHVRVIVALAIIAAAALVAPALAGDGTVGSRSHFLRGAYQAGKVLATNSFVEGENLSGEPIDTYHGARLEFGWQTSGEEDWHHLYNFPTYGLGINACNYFNDEELGKPTSIYGFFGWPVKRWGRSTLNVDLGFGLADNWVAFDEVENPYNVAIGAGRSVYIDVGMTYEMPLAKRWWLLAGFTGTHYSNGGSQQPNWGMNQVGPLVYVKYDLQERKLPQVRRKLGPFEPTWEVAATFSFGVRNLEKDLRGDEEFGHYYTKDYLATNVWVMANRQFSHMSAYSFGLDIDYDESVDDLVTIESLNAGKGVPGEVSTIEKMGLSVCGGYEHRMARAGLIVRIGYTVARKEVEGRLPRLYQRLGLKYDILDGVHMGLNVRFNDFSRANNLEFNMGYDWSL